MDQQHRPRPPAGDQQRAAHSRGTGLNGANFDGAGPIDGTGLCGSGSGGWNEPMAAGQPEHRPRRPDWGCQVCDQAWPCRQGQVELLAQYANDRVGLLVYLAGLLVDAVQEIDAPPNLLLDRFLRWAKIGEAQ